MPPTEPAARERWMGAVSAVDASRDRWGIGNNHKPLGSDGAVKAIEGLSHRTRARVAVRRALGLSEIWAVIGNPQTTSLHVEPSQDRSESVAM
jgi:hypothetical protein